MENQGQGWLRGAIIAAAVAAAGVYFVSKGDAQEGAAGAATSTGRSTLDAFGSSEVGKRGSRIVEILLGNTADQAMDQVKAVLKNAIRQLDHLVDEL